MQVRIFRRCFTVILQGMERKKIKMEKINFQTVKNSFNFLLIYILLLPLNESFIFVFENTAFSFLIRDLFVGTTRIKLELNQNYFPYWTSMPSVDKFASIGLYFNITLGLKRNSLGIVITVQKNL